MEEGGWKSLLVINTESLCKIKSAKKRGKSIIDNLYNLSQLPSSINQKFLSRTEVK
ncbi:hypothetical protein J2Y40_001351 [Chryseobacterium sp. 2987]|nr:hypothetical protein [Chryseobacterium sp. 2987]